LRDLHGALAKILPFNNKPMGLSLTARHGIARRRAYGDLRLAML
jgi:hypothetical protein